jgi:hypothetical protein
MPCKFRIGVGGFAPRLTLPISVHIFKQTMVVGACLAMFVNGWNFVVQIYYIPTFYQLAYGYSAVRSAALLLPLVMVQSTFCFHPSSIA